MFVSESGSSQSGLTKSSMMTSAIGRAVRTQRASRPCAVRTVIRRRISMLPRMFSTHAVEDLGRVAACLALRAG